jgi:hypothetical protein
VTLGCLTHVPARGPSASSVMALGFSDGSLQFVDSSTGEMVRELSVGGHTDSITCLAFSADGLRLVSGGRTCMHACIRVLSFLALAAVYVVLIASNWVTSAVDRLSRPSVGCLGCTHRHLLGLHGGSSALGHLGCLVGVGLYQEEEWCALLRVCLALFRGSGLSREWVRSLASSFRMILPVYVQAKAVREDAQWRLLRLTTPFGECAPCDNHSSLSVVIYCLVAHSPFRCVSIHAWTASGRRSFV